MFIDYFTRLYVYSFLSFPHSTILNICTNPLLVLVVVSMIKQNSKLNGNITGIFENGTLYLLKLK